MPQYGIFVKNGDGRYKLSDPFYSAPSRIYASVWYISKEWGWGYKLFDKFYSAPSRVYAPIWYISHEWEWGV